MARRWFSFLLISELTKKSKWLRIASNINRSAVTFPKALRQFKELRTAFEGESLRNSKELLMPVGNYKHSDASKIKLISSESEVIS